MAVINHHFLRLVGLAAVLCQSLTSGALETVTVPLPTQGTSFKTTVSACGSEAPFVILGDPYASFHPGTHTIFLPPQASAITTSFAHSLGRWNATGVIIATPLPGSCGPLSLPAAATDTVAVTHPHHYPLPTGTFVPYGNVSNSSNSTWPPPLLPPYVNTTHLCPVRTCAEALLSKSARHITSFLNTVTLATQNLESAVLSIGGRGSTRHGSALEPRDHILEKLVLPLKDIAATLSFNLPILSAHPAIHHACDSDTITSAVSAFVDAQTALLQVLIGKVDVLLGHGDARLEDVRGRRDDETVGGDLVAHGSGVGAKEDFHIPFVDSVIRGALKLIKRGVDELVFDLIAILPSRAGCLRQEGEYLDDVLDEAIAALE